MNPALATIGERSSHTLPGALMDEAQAGVLAGTDFTPDLATARLFLNLLDADGTFTFQTFDDGAKKRGYLNHVSHGTVDEHAPLLSALAADGAGVFVTVNETDGQGRSANNVTRVRAVFLDLDGATLPQETEFPLAPHIVVESSPGRWHVYWLVDGLELRGFRDVQRTIAARFGGDATICDLPRVMRMPGFYHRKHAPFLTRLVNVEQHVSRYSADQVKAAFGTAVPSTSSRHEIGSEAQILVGPVSPRVAPEGVRNDHLTKRAGELRRLGLDEAAIATRLETVNDDECDPPLARAELSVIAKSVARYPSGTHDLERSMTDVGNADRFVAQCTDQFRFIHSAGAWIHWNGTRWVPDASGAVIESAKQVATSIFDDVADLARTNPVGASSLANHARNSLQEARIRSMVTLARSKPPMPAEQSTFDANDMLLGTESGVIDLNSGEHRPGQRDDYHTKQARVKFDKAATCPEFEKFLRRIMGGNDELISFLQRAVGYTLSGATTEQCLFFLYGGGANGKSTFLNVIQDLMGDYAMQTAPETLVAKKQSGNANNDVARLCGPRLVISNEVEDGSRLAENLVKQFTGGDTITARALYKEFFEFKPKFKLWIAGNHKPIIKGDDHAIWRRIRLVPFTVTVPEAERDPELAIKLKSERAGILNWALAGFREWLLTGLKPPAEVLQAVEEYRLEMDLIGQWLAERTVEATGSKMTASDAHADYRAWAERGGYPPMSKNRFGRKLTDRGVKRCSPSDGSYLDIRLGAPLPVMLTGIAV